MLQKSPLSCSLLGQRLETGAIFAASQMQTARCMPTAAELNQVSERIIGAAVAVHRRIGPGCLESAYSPCLAVELHKRGVIFRTKVALTLTYDELVIPRAYEADFIVEEEVVIEVKALARVGDQERRQLNTYLRLEGYPLGLLLNFGAATLVDGITRVVNNFPEGTRSRDKYKK
jgi:GxxExxY protein